MAATATETTLRPVPEVAAHRVKARGGGWTDWVTTVDHKKIGIMYMVTAFVFFLVGGVEALLMRLQLGAPNNTLLDPQIYNQMFTMHGQMMIFLFVVPVMAAFGNYIVPLQIGARDMAFPKLNAASLWLLVFGGLAMYSSFLFANGPDAGWTSYPPLSEQSPGHGIDFWIVGLHI